LGLLGKDKSEMAGWGSLHLVDSCRARLGQDKKRRGMVPEDGESAGLQAGGFIGTHGG